jgi:hypothetical protein
MNANFINKKFPDLHSSPEVNKAIIRKNVREGTVTKISSETSSSPEKKLNIYFDRFRKILSRNPNSMESQQGIEAIKKVLQKNFVIKKSEIPESIYLAEQTIARNEGNGKIEITQEYKAQKNQEIVNIQTESLDQWVDYLKNTDTGYSLEFKYFVIRGIVQLADYNKEKKEFNKRSKGTTKAFPEIDFEALGIMQSILTEEKTDIDDEIIKLKNANFGKLYAVIINKLDSLTQEKKENINGAWVKYDQGESGHELSNSLKGYRTGWCTAAMEVAQSQLQQGDFYVYYSKDTDGNDRIPRVAIRMDNGRIAEIRGVNKSQELEPEVTDIMEEKAKSLVGYELFKKATADMRKMTEIDGKVNSNVELNSKELSFLYEIESKISSFGYKTDPRIKEIIDKRDVKKDLEIVLNTTQEKISLTNEEILNGGKECHFGDVMILDPELGENFSFPKIILGKFMLRGGLTDSTKLPQNITEYLWLYGINNGQTIEISEVIVGEGVVIKECKNIKKFVFPKTVNKSIHISQSIISEELMLPEKLNGNLTIASSIIPPKITLPRVIEGSVTIRISAKNPSYHMTLPEKITGECFILGADYKDFKKQSVAMPLIFKNIIFDDGALTKDGFVSADTIIDSDLYDDIVHYYYRDYDEAED